MYIHQIQFLVAKDLYRGQSHLNLRQIQCFIALTETLHFGRAAEKVHMTQPAFSRHIKNLECALDLSLVHRDSHSVSLTTAGKAYLAGCKEAIRALDTAASDARLYQEGFIGKIQIGYTEFAIIDQLPYIMCDFKQEFPRVVQISIQGDTADLLSRVHDKTLDIAFVTGPIVADDLNSIPVSNNRVLAILYDTHPLARKQTLTMADLVHEEFVSGDPGVWAYYLKHIERAFDEFGERPTTVQTAYSSEGLFGIVAGKLGVTLYPDCVANFYRSGLVFREVADLDITIPTLAVWRTDDQAEVLGHFLSSLNKFLEKSTTPTP